ncbi:MAG: hypothetical protein JWO86_1392 [Myxococcaceae bacterium]|nr:hypothetical protein [Myxococcaceae bacterium]
MTDKDLSKKNEKNENNDVKKSPRAPAQSLTDEERGDWEGMGQSRYQPDAPPASKPVGTPTPGSNSLAGEKQK